VGNRQIGPEQPPYIIAELGVNHNGSLPRALDLVESAHAAGADAVKLQWFEAERLLSRAARLASYQATSGARDPVEMLRALELEPAEVAGVVKRARGLGLHAIVSLFTVDHVEPAHTLGFDAFKTASPDVVNRPLLEALMAAARPLFVSTGAATLDEIAETAAWLGEHPHVLMHCVSAYPTPDTSASLAGRAAMLEVSPHALGYSDHTTAVDTGGLAVASGACVLEKHLTFDRRAPGPDHAASLDPEQFEAYVRMAHRARAMLGPRCKRVLQIEQDVRASSRQSLTTRRALPAGAVVVRDDLTIKRPGVGIAPSRLSTTVGRRLVRSVEADTPLREEDLE
jgi:N-acetylneuraminate synthase/N,N'-diacetyllegionaminate synthase